MIFWKILFIVDGVLFALMAFTSLYLAVYAIASLFARRPDIPKTKRLNRFIVLIPA